MNSLLERTWAEIHLDNIEHNYNAIRARIGSETKFMGVVKANAYGHGAVEVSKLLQTLGGDYLAVATLGEAIELRKNDIKLPILVLGVTSLQHVGELLSYDLTQTICSQDSAKKISEEAMKLGKKVRVHLKIDTGMSRLGFTCNAKTDPTEELLEVMRLEGLNIEGIFSHLAVSELTRSAFTDRQVESFNSLVKRLEANSWIEFKIKHCANSGGMINYKSAWFDMVRTGLALYGLYPAGEVSRLELRPAMSIKSRIIQTRFLSEGETVSYGRKFTADSLRRIAVVPIGYADGLHRVLSGRFDFLVNGKRAAQIGRICMDMCMIDITDIPDVQEGTEVTLFGFSNGEIISVDEIAAAAGTISYEILTSFSERVPRVYYRGGVIQSL